MGWSWLSLGVEAGGVGVHAASLFFLPVGQMATDGNGSWGLLREGAE